MSKKSSKLDLLVRVRFENPVPDPPFPPKLLNVSTDITRLGEPSYLDQLVSSAPVPMLLDAEMGMPVDLNEFEGVWDGDDTAINPTTNPSRVTDPADLELLTPLQIISANGRTPGTSTPLGKPDVSWMRNTSYMSKKEAATRRRHMAEKRAEVVDASEAAQIHAITKTFDDVRSQPLEDIRHPDVKRKHLRVVETYDILPDDDAWSNSYILIKFPERPSAATAANPGALASRPRLDRAILRPIMQDDQQIMEFFLPKEDDLGRVGNLESTPLNAEDMEKVRAEMTESADEIFENVTFDRIRTYEVVQQTPQDMLQKELLLTFVEEPSAELDDDDDMFGDDERPKKKRKGVYFKNINMRTQLRKTRAKRAGEDEARADTWDKVRVAFRDPEEEEVGERDAQSRAVKDPRWSDEQLRVLRGEDIGRDFDDDDDE